MSFGVVSVLCSQILFTAFVFSIVLGNPYPRLSVCGFTFFDVHSPRGLLFKHVNLRSTWNSHNSNVLDLSKDLDMFHLACTSKGKAPEDLLGPCCREASGLACGGSHSSCLREGATFWVTLW